MVTDPYEYKKSYNQHRYELTGSVTAGHPFSYIKRRRMQSESKYTGFRPFCKCGWKSVVWHLTKQKAMLEHNEHARQYDATRPTLLP